MPDKIFDRSIVDDKAQKMWDDLSEESRQHFLKDLKCFKCSSSDSIAALIEEPMVGGEGRIQLHKIQINTNTLSLYG